jgi:hypothetical protein
LMFRNQCCTRKTKKGSRSHPSLVFFAINVAQGKPKKGAAPIRRLNFRNQCCTRKTKGGSRSRLSLPEAENNTLVSTLCSNSNLCKPVPLDAQHNKNSKVLFHFLSSIRYVSMSEVLHLSAS